MTGLGLLAVSQPTLSVLAPPLVTPGLVLTLPLVLAILSLAGPPYSRRPVHHRVTTPTIKAALAPIAAAITGSHRLAAVAVVALALTIELSDVGSPCAKSLAEVSNV